MNVGRDRWRGIALLTAGVCALVATMSISLAGGIASGPAGPGVASRADGRRAPRREGAGRAAGVRGKRGPGVDTARPPAPAADPRDDYDVAHYLLDLWLDFDTDEIGGGVTVDAVVTAATIDSLVLDLFDNMTVDSVRAGGAPAGFTHTGDQVRIALDRIYAQGDTASPTVYYHGHPQYTGWATFRWTQHDNPPVPEVHSISWPDNSRGWWPCKDVLTDKATAEIRVTAPNDARDLMAAAIGRFDGVVDNPDGTRTWRWIHGYPVTTYNVAFACTNYDVLKGSYVGIDGDTLAIRHYVYPEDRSLAEEDFSGVPDMIAAFENRYGPYPYAGEKYGMAVVGGLSGAMEHQTMVSYGRSLISGQHTYDMIVAHELAHMWFGDMIGYGTWGDIWLSEGFATWSEAIYRESTGGLDAYLAYMQTLDTQDFNDTVYDPNVLLGDTPYNKGAWVVHMLRYVMGDDLFFQTLAAYTADPAFRYGTIVTSDFIDFWQTAYGAPLDWFFDPWLYEIGRPAYYVGWHGGGPGDSSAVSVRIDQTQAGVLYTMPLELRFETASGMTSFTVRDSLRTQYFDLTLPEPPIGLTLDPHNWVLKIVQAPLAITTDSVPPGVPGEQYAFVLRGEGGVFPVTWSILEGALPDSLDLDPALGLISGVPSGAGTFDFTVELRDSFDPAHADSASFSLVIEGPSGIEGEIGGHGTGTMPRAFALGANYPNPFNPSTMIPFDVPEGARGSLRLTIYDVRGRLVRTLTEGSAIPGRHEAHWDGRDDRGAVQPSGLYLYRLDAAGFVSTRRMLLVR